MLRFYTCDGASEEEEENINSMNKRVARSVEDTSGPSNDNWSKGMGVQKLLPDISLADKTRRNHLVGWAKLEYRQASVISPTKYFFLFYSL